MKIAVQGCTHGELETVYNTLQHLEARNNVKIDLLLCCGDFQATRNLDDLSCMACPPKYREMCSFYKYYSGEKSAPVLTVFIGGNHEASNHLQELPFGGWVAPNIYYLGYAGVVKFGNLRIAGLSGIFNREDYYKGRYERPPYHPTSLRSVYHIRNLDVFRLKQLSQPVHIMMSHDWPAGIYKHGNVQLLTRMKPFLKDDIKNEDLGSKPTEELLHHMKPNYWFAAHLHVKFPALVEHKQDDSKKLTRFLALDKCLPGRRFLQVIDIGGNAEEKPQLEYDLEWLTVLYLTNHLLSVSKCNVFMPTANSNNERWNFTPTAEELDKVRKRFENDLRIPENFIVSAPVYDPATCNKESDSLKPRFNPQTLEFCDKLAVDDPIVLLTGESGGDVSKASLSSSTFNGSSFIGSTDSELEATTPSPSPFRTPLKLPKPINSSAISDDGCITSTPFRATRKTKAEEDPQPTGEADEGVSSRGKAKFWRRNSSIYASTDE